MAAAAAPASRGVGSQALKVCLAQLGGEMRGPGLVRRAESEVLLDPPGVVEAVDVLDQRLIGLGAGGEVTTAYSVLSVDHMFSASALMLT